MDMAYIATTTVLYDRKWYDCGKEYDLTADEYELLKGYFEPVAAPAAAEEKPAKKPHLYFRHR